MNERYLGLMEKALSAYTDEHIIRYFKDVKKDGLKEHGFPRLTANIGILIAYGKRLDLTLLFREMMEFCCKTIPNVKAANDFSVREIVCCIEELEKNGGIALEDIARWKDYLATIEPKKCYNKFAEKATDPVRNWALFTGVSEYFRQSMGLCDSSEFIDIQIASQLQWFDENGMYMDNPKSEIHQPMMYDIVPRGLFSVLLHRGYRGRYYEQIDEILKKSGLLTLKMQSVRGESPFGGRSNQFINNEAWFAAIFEYEAVRYQREGNYDLAGRFKAAAIQALGALKEFLSKKPITHIKNRFPIDSKYGCESYAYFDKYMITAASFLYMASLFCDDSIAPSEFDESSMIWSTSKYFHKTFARAGGYSLEFDTDADEHYDANGLGRIHKKGAPSAICLSVPFPKELGYDIGKYSNKTGFSICPTVKDENGQWQFGADIQTQYSLIKNIISQDQVELTFKCIFLSEIEVYFNCLVNKNGVFIEVRSETDKEVGLAFPVLYFDGERQAEIIKKDGALCVNYDGWVCEYETPHLEDLKTDFANRNGIYKGYMAIGTSSVKVRVAIYPLEQRE